MLKDGSKVVAIVQARSGSTRLPGKVLKILAGRPMLLHVIERVKACNMLDDIVIATTSLRQDRPIIKLAEQAGVSWFAGSEKNVLQRYVKAAQMSHADVVVRVTSDCPLIDPVTVDNTVMFFEVNSYDYVVAGVESGFPRGLDTEVFTLDSLVKADRRSMIESYREHVTPYIYNHPEEFFVGKFPAPSELYRPGWRLCVDEEDDFKLVDEIYKRLYRPETIIDIRQVVKLLDKSPDLLKINAGVRQKTV